jgi:hypothetical protein
MAIEHREVLGFAEARRLAQGRFVGRKSNMV